MSTNFCKMALVSRFDVHKTVAQKEFMEVPGINFHTNLLVLIFVSKSSNFLP